MRLKFSCEGQRGPPPWRLSNRHLAAGQRTVQVARCDGSGGLCVRFRWREACCTSQAVHAQFARGRRLALPGLNQLTDVRCAPDLLAHARTRPCGHRDPTHDNTRHSWCGPDATRCGPDATWCGQSVLIRGISTILADLTPNPPRKGKHSNLRPAISHPK